MVAADAPGEGFNFKTSRMAKNGFPITELTKFIVILKGGGGEQGPPAPPPVPTALS